MGGFLSNPKFYKTKAGQLIIIIIGGFILLSVVYEIYLFLKNHLVN